MPLEHTPAKSDKKKDIKALVFLRGQAKAQVTKIRNALDDIAGAGAEAPSMAMLAVYSKKLDNFYNEYRIYHEQIVEVIPEEQWEEQMETFDAFESQHFEACMLLEAVMNSIADANPAHPQANPQLPDTPRIIVQQQPLKAPIPTFDGKPENWPRFKAMFLDVMRTSADSDAIKLYHLDRALVGTAAGIIDSCTLSQNNYAHAWQILEDRFEDQRVIVDIHINGLLGLKKMHRKMPGS